MSEPRSDAEWTDFYGERSDLYRAFVERLQALVETLLKDEGIDRELVFSWNMTASELHAALTRARRNGSPIDRPLAGGAAVAGVTVTLATAEALPDLLAVVDREIVVDETESRVPDGAGASLAVSLDERRAELPEWEAYEGLRATIEVKTALQEAWGTVDDELPFFWLESYPTELAEVIERSAVAIQRVDADLVEAKAALARLYEEYKEAVETGDLDLSLNALSLAAYVSRAEIVASLVRLGQDLGLRSDEEYEASWSHIEQGVFWLVREELSTLRDVEEFLERMLPRAEEILTELVVISEERNFTPWALSDSIVEWLWLVDTRADAETVALVGYTDALTYALDTLIGNS